MPIEERILISVYYLSSKSNIMGGGDLNMKKSWHPQRMDNQEKVWKKEEASKKERQRMAELKRQMAEEREIEDMQKRGEDSGVLKKKKDRVDWMYHQPELKEEDYLMGKKVDKAILEHQETKAKESASGGSSLVVDMAKKVKEDPLFAIKKKEISHRKSLMNNPIRMKQLQEMLKAQVDSKEGKKKAKKSKHEKSKKRRDERDSSEERRWQKKTKKSARRRDDSSESDSDEEERRERKREKAAKSSRRRTRSSSENDSSEDERKRRRAKEKRRRERRDSSDERDDGRTARGSSHRGRDRREDEPRKVVPHGYGLIGGKKSSHRRRASSSESEDDRHGDRYSSRQPDKRPDRGPKKRPKAMDADELERRRAEMMDNAKWRDEQRHDRVKKYRDEESAEHEAERRKTKDAKFLDTMRLPNNSSVEDRIKRNIYKIQRTNAALDKNFARR